MSVFRITCRLKNKDVNMFRKLRTSVLMEILQEISIAHTEQLGAGRNKTLDRGFLWVIMQQNIRILHMPEYDDEITVLSWPGKTMHVLFPRFYRIIDSEGKLLVEGSALWALIDQNTRKMIFPEQNGITVEGEETGEEYPLPARIAAEETEQTGTFHVPFSYCDLNGHMNNTRYFDLLDDMLAGSDPTPASIQAEYHHEIRCHNDVVLKLHRDQEHAYMEGESGDQLCFRMKVTFPAADQQPGNLTDPFFKKRRDTIV